MIYAPIWKDTYFTSTADSVTYTVKDSHWDIYQAYGNQDTVFIGKAVRLPGADTVKVKVNEICQNFVGFSDTDDDSLMEMFDYMMASQYRDNPGYSYSSGRHNGGTGIFYVYNDGVLINSYCFLNDWSYEDWTGQTGTITRNINTHYDPRMFIADSTVSTGGSQVPSRPDARMVGTTITVPYASAATYCGDYAIYYVGAKGGLTSFLFEGVCRRVDNLKEYTYSKSFDNNTVAFENKRFALDIDRTFELNTGWLDDLQSELFAEDVLKSTTIYLHNLKTDELMPAVIVDNQAEYKTYRGNERKRVNYTITIKASQTRVRR